MSSKWSTKEKKMDRMKVALSSFACLLLSLHNNSFSSVIHENNCAELSIYNESYGTLLISYSRQKNTPFYVKLLEVGEVITFGKVYEASVQSYSTLWGCIAPSKENIFGPKIICPAVSDVIIRVKGAANRSFLQPFGKWDCELVFNKKVFEVFPQTFAVPVSDNVLELFPTAKRKIMYTPRFILGLPHQANADDAIQAACSLEEKWNACFSSSTDNKLLSNIRYLIEESKKAFECGQEDVQLHVPFQMRSCLVPWQCTDEVQSTAWT